MVVLLHRKIWPPSMTPLFVMLYLLAYHYRASKSGAFAWGLAGWLLAQVHPGGMFLCTGFAGSIYYQDRQGARWRYFLAGGFVGLVLLLPWLNHAREAMLASPIGQRKFGNMIEGKFWLRWVTEAFGFSLHYTLGQDFQRFLAGPMILGQRTYGIAFLHTVLAAGAVVLLVQFMRTCWKSDAKESAHPYTRQMLIAMAWGFGGALTLTMLPIHRHYMVLTFPMIPLSLAYLVYPLHRGRYYLAAIFVAHWLISISFLQFVHTHKGMIPGDYGTPYCQQ
jgi:hypothetical protein